jgi:UDP-N-acetylglucosamine 3-dehydrogenase
VTLNIGLIGAGNISRVHLSALQDLPAGKVIGLYDADPARAQQRASEFGVERIYSSQVELLGDPNVQVVAVLVPPFLHAPVAIAALEAGKHVVTEKPMAGSLAECDSMIEAGRKAGRRMLTVQNRIFSPAYEAARDLIRDGAIGTVFMAQTDGFEGPDTVFRTSWLMNALPGNGVLLAQAVHPAYTLRWMLGEVDQVSATFGGRKVVDTAEEDTAIVTFRFASGVIVSMTATFGLRNGPFDHAIKVFGDDGYIEIRGQAGVPPLRVISPTTYGDRELHEVELPESPNHAAHFRSMWEDYLRSFESGQPGRVDEIDGRKAVEMILAAHRSSETGRAVPLPLKE